MVSLRTTASRFLNASRVWPQPSAAYQSPKSWTARRLPIFSASLTTCLTRRCWRQGVVSPRHGGCRTPAPLSGARAITLCRWRVQRLGAAPMAPIAACAPGEAIDITLSFVAPLEAGNYRSTWRLADPGQNLFGDAVWTEFRVAIAAPAGAAVAAAAGARARGGAHRPCWQAPCRPQMRRWWPWRWASSTRPTGCACWPPRRRRTHSRPCRLRPTMHWRGLRG